MNVTIVISIIYGFGLIIATIGFLLYIKKYKKNSRQFEANKKNSSKKDLDLKIICK